MQIRILYLAGCPHLGPTIELVRRVTRTLAVDDRIEIVEVRSPIEAVALRFLGSPTVQVDGVDVVPEARSATSFALSCRLYGDAGIPSEALVEHAILEARR